MRPGRHDAETESVRRRRAAWRPAARVGDRCPGRTAGTLRAARAGGLEPALRTHAGTADPGPLSGHRGERLPPLPFTARLDSPRGADPGGLGRSRPGPD